MAIVIEVSLLIAFQMLAGSLYFALALLTGAFMVGLSVGAWTRERTRARVGVLAFEAALVAWSAVIVIAVGRLALSGPGSGAALIVFLVLLAGQGAVTGALFAAAAGLATESDEVGHGAGRVYGVELLAGALAGLLVSAVMVPAFGIMFSLAGAMLAAAALALTTAVSKLS